MQKAREGGQGDFKRQKIVKKSCSTIQNVPYVNGPPAGGGPCWAPEPVAPSCPERAGAVHISKNIFLSGLAIFFPGVLGEPVPFPGSARSGGAAPPYWRSRLSGGPYREISSIPGYRVAATQRRSRRSSALFINSAVCETSTSLLILPGLLVRTN